MSVGSSKQTLCRLCLNVIGSADFEVIDEIKSEIIQVVLPSLDLETKYIHMCRTCHVKLIAAFNFKSICRYTDDVIISYMNSEQMPVVDLKDVYSKKGNVQLIDLSENQKICRLCMQLVTCGFKSLNEVDVDIIVNYIPEVNINATKGPVICELCFDSLCTHASFVKNCLNGQENYEQCCNKTEKIEIKTEQSDLFSNPNSEEFKTEKTCLDALEQYTQSYIKTEQIDIKAEESDQDSDLVGTIDDCVHQCRAREVQIDEGKLRIQKSEAASTKGEYKNQHKFDTPELERYEYNGSEYRTNCEQSFTGHQSIHKDCSEVHENPSEAQMYNNSTKNRSKLKGHLLMHKDPSEVQIYKCYLCNYEAKRRESLKRHLLMHKDPSEIQMYKCNACSYESRYKRYLNYHQLTHKDPSKMDLYKCDTCSFKTKYKYALKRHLLLHIDPSKMQMYMCNACNYRSTMKLNLKQHQLTHKNLSEIQMHKCDVCSYETKYKGALKQHQLLHKDVSEIQMHKCDKCSYKSKYKSRLNQHQLTHKDPSVIQTYKCDSCSFETMHKGALKGHLLRHKDPSRVQKYKCDSCSFETRHKGALKGHLLTHEDPSQVQMYKCELCSCETKYKRYLNQHKLKKHGNSSKA